MTDALGDPLLAVKVALRRHAGEPCRNATTNATGAYALNMPKHQTDPSGGILLETR